MKKPVMFDSSCGEAVAWNDPDAPDADQFKDDHVYANDTNRWVRVTRKITAAYAIEVYGEVTNIELGPRGGFRSITFGTTCFITDDLRNDAQKLARTLSL